MKSKYCCPECKQPLSLGVNEATQDYLIWCAIGTCSSLIANDGQVGKTELEAFENLERAIEREEENNNKATK